MDRKRVSETLDIETAAAARPGDTLGYARVSTPDQCLSAQRNRLLEAGAIRVFTDVASGKRSDRPGLAELIDHARPGDRLCVTRLDRLGRSLRELLETVDDLKARGIHLVSRRGAPRHLLVRRRARVPCLRRDRALRATADLRAHARRDRRGAKTRPSAGPATTRSGDGFSDAETHRKRPIGRSSSQAARHRQSNSVQNRRRIARRTGCIQ